MMQEKGLTLVELMVVLAVLGILATFTAPTLSRWSANVRFNAAARAIVAGLQLARMKAIALGADMEACFYPAREVLPGKAATAEWFIFSAHEKGQNWCQAPPKPDQKSPEFQSFIKTTVSLPAGIKFREEPETIIFQPRGSVQPGTNDTITIENSQNPPKIAHIIVAQSGRIRLQKVQ